MKKPPKIGKFILRRIYDDDLYDEILGDFQEVYGDRLVKEGAFVASAKYILDALLSVRNIGLRKRVTRSRPLRMAIVVSYLKMGFRILRKNFVTSLISISGLAVALGCTITTFLWADFQSHLDNFHVNRNNIYQIISHIDEEGVDVLYGASPLLLAEQLVSDHQGVRSVTRFQYHHGNVQIGGDVYRESLLFVDPAFLEIFDFPMLQGNRHSLDGEMNIILSKKMAEKYFGYKDPSGKQVTVAFSGGTVRSFVVAGVLADAPESASFKPEILIPFHHYKDLITGPVGWEAMAAATLVKLREDASPADLEVLMKDYRQKQNQADISQPIEHFEFIRLTDLASRSDEIYRPVAYGSSPSDYMSMAFVGLLILLLACCNYLNIAISSGTHRLKEIALRKTMGSYRGGIIYQFLAENSIICGFSVVFGVGLCYFFFLPGFNMIAPVEVPFAFSSWEVAVVFYISIWLFMAVLSGAYPAFYISRFRPALIFGGRQKFSNKNFLSRMLLTLQLFLAFLTIVSGFIFTDNAMYVKALQWGYEQDHVLSIRIPDPQQLEVLKTIAENEPSVISAGGSKGHIGVQNPFVQFQYLNKNFRALHYETSPGYLHTMRVKLVSGRLFEQGKRAEEAHGVIVSEAFVDKMSWEEPLGREILLGGKQKIVIGVVGNIWHSFFSEDDIRPMIFTCPVDPVSNFLVVRYDPGALVHVDEMLRAEFQMLNPDSPYDRVFQSEIFNRHYDNVDANIILMMTIAALAIFLSCLGLYGLMVYRMQIRVREIGIRKVLGAGRKHIIGLATREYAWIMGVAFGLGVPLGAYGIHQTVTSLFSVSKPFSIFPVAVAILITGFAVVLTVLKEILNVLRINPAETLRD